MMFIKQRLILIFCLFLLPNAVNAGTIDKAFKALQQYNYFDAKALFEKVLKKEPSAANYGLAVIYSRTDNPFHNLDSAYSKIQVSEANYAALKEKTKVKYKAYQFDYLAIVTLRASISTVFFKQALAQPTESGMDTYQRKHPWAQERFIAIHLRDSIGFKVAADKSTSVAYNNFLKTYPESEFASRAQKEFYRLQYLEQTTSGTLSTYMSFEKSFPGNPYVADAQDQIYRLATVQNTVETFKAFIKAYPSNRNVDQAWRRLYQLYMSDYSSSRVEAFQKEYPNYPFKQELIRDKELAGSVLIPYKQESLFGWMSLNGTIVIPAAYESVGFFKDGLAWVEKNGKYGYVNKANELVIDFRYTGANDFEKGRAIVEQDEKFGIIDRTGALIFLTEFNDLGQFSENLIYAQKDSLYGYFDEFGFQRIQPEYSEAFSFSGGKARVKVGELDAFIDPYGAYIVPPLYEEVEFFNDSLLTFVDGEFMGLMNRKGKIIAAPTYESI
ncbi:MAG: WG repeat-containing protein, partial [Flavobacteriia bacterium]|nr:WG repeat-containing protein [Flavobacteriia bacterium]